MTDVAITQQPTAQHLHLSNGRGFIMLMIFLVTTAFWAGVGFATFQTKTEAKEDKKELMDFMERTYMPRELSLEKWRNNSVAHAQIQVGLNRLLNRFGIASVPDTTGRGERP